MRTGTEVKKMKSFSPSATPAGEFDRTSRQHTRGLHDGALGVAAEGVTASNSREVQALVEHARERRIRAGQTDGR